MLIFFKSHVALEGFLGGSLVENQLANARDVGSIPGSGRSPGVGNGNALQYYCLENLMGTEESGSLQSTGFQRVRHD